MAILQQPAGPRRCGIVVVLIAPCGAAAILPMLDERGKRGDKLRRKRPEHLTGTLVRDRFCDGYRHIAEGKRGGRFSVSAAAPSTTSGPINVSIS